jgi:arginine deiminase
VVILHRPGAELQRLDPRNNDKLLFDGLACGGQGSQSEHDACCAPAGSKCC